MNKTSTILGVVVALGIAAIVVLSTTTLGETILNVTLKTNQNLERGLVLHWTFDGKDMVSNVADVSGTGNDGDLFGQTSTTTVTGIHGQALELDGSDDYVGVLDNSTLDFGGGDMTVSLWAWSPDETASSETLAAKIAGSPSSNAGWQIGWTVDDAYFSVSDGGSSEYAIAQYAPDGFARDGKWHHWVGVYRSSTAELWIDGDNLASDNDPENYDNNNTLRAGQRGDGIPFKGLIDDLRVYNRALSAEEISRLRELGATTRIQKTLESGLALDSNLVGHWTFDGKDMVNNVADVSGQGNHGALQGQTSTTTARGIFGQALDLDGSDDYVEIQNHSSLALTSVYTISAWIRPESIVSETADYLGNQIFFKGGLEGDPPYNLQFMIRDEGGAYKVGFFSETSSTNRATESGDVVELNKWQHVVATYDGSNGRIYKNGSLVAGPTTWSNFSGDSGTIEIGNGDLGTPFDGQLDDVRVYDYSLSAEEISRLYELGATTRVNTTLKSGLALDSGLVGHWTFDGKNMVNNVADVSGTGNNGFLQNQTPTTTARGVIGQAMQFDGTDDTIIVPDHSSMDFGTATEFSNSFWVRMDGGGEITDFLKDVTTGDGWDILYHTERNGIRAFITNNGSGFCTIDANSTDIADGEWHHVAVVFHRPASCTSTSYDIYVDGIAENTVLEASSAAPNTSVSNAVDFEIVRGDTRTLNGLIDDVRVYNRALTADEVSRLYEMGR